MGSYAAAISLLVALLVLLVVVARLRGALQREIVHEWEVGLLYRDGRFERTLAPGRYRFFDPFDRLTVARIATVERQTRFGAIEVFTADRFAFRLHLALRYRIVDPRAAHELMAANLSFGEIPGLHDTVAAAAIAVAGNHSLDDMIGNPAESGSEIAARLSTTPPLIEVFEVTVTRIELPPEIRRMLTEVERARRDGMASLERARGEQAALRSLANAARIIRDNPELANLRLLQTIEASKGPTTIVVGDPRDVARPSP